MPAAAEPDLVERAVALWLGGQTMRAAGQAVGRSNAWLGGILRQRPDYPALAAKARQARQSAKLGDPGADPAGQAKTARLKPLKNPRVDCQECGLSVGAGCRCPVCGLRAERPEIVLRRAMVRQLKRQGKFIVDAKSEVVG